MTLTIRLQNTSTGDIQPDPSDWTLQTGSGEIIEPTSSLAFPSALAENGTGVVQVGFLMRVVTGETLVARFQPHGSSTKVTWKFAAPYEGIGDPNYYWIG